VIVPALLILVGACLRAAMLVPNRFRVDEALYATFAREVATGGDPLLLAFDVDKPPLAVYATAVAFAALGVSEFAARVPNVLASVASLAVLWALGRRLYSLTPQPALPLGEGASNTAKARLNPTACFAVLLVALSPYDVLFAPTVFAEPQVTLWTLLACWAVAGDRWAWAGGLLALGIATKQSALFYAPLVVALGVVLIAGNATADWRAYARRVVRLALPVLVCGALLALWDAPRGPGRSFWALGYAHNAPGRWIRSGEVLPRLGAWGFWLSTFTGAEALNVALLVLGIGGLAWGVIFRSRRRETVIDLVLVGYALAYLGMLWLLAFNTYDRYVHTLLPVLALLAARGVACALAQIQRGPKPAVLALAGLVVVACLVGPLGEALAGEMPVGGDKGEYDGIEQVAAFLNGLPAGVEVCDHWLGWELGFYLGREPAIRMTWYPRPDVLVERLNQGAAGTPCYLPAPADAPVGRWLATASRAGFEVAEVFAAMDRWGERSFVVYVIGE
jgi:4-amino-4-deoxy-L-arabinose transferase-like glycosyltransferase